MLKLSHELCFATRKARKACFPLPVLEGSVMEDAVQETHSTGQPGASPPESKVALQNKAPPLP